MENHRQLRPIRRSNRNALVKSVYSSNNWAPAGSEKVAGSFEAASQPLLDELPGFDTGVCVVGGTAIGMLTRLEVPLFESVAVENDSSPPSPLGGRAPLPSGRAGSARGRRRSSLSVSRCRFGPASRDAVAKLRLDGTPTPRSWVARMTKRPTPTGARQERLPVRRPHLSGVLQCLGIVPAGRMAPATSCTGSRGRNRTRTGSRSSN